MGMDRFLSEETQLEREKRSTCNIAQYAVWMWSVPSNIVMRFILVLYTLGLWSGGAEVWWGMNSLLGHIRDHPSILIQQCNTYKTIQYNTIQCYTIQCNAIHQYNIHNIYNTIQYNPYTGPARIHPSIQTTSHPDLINTSLRKYFKMRRNDPHLISIIFHHYLLWYPW